MTSARDYITYIYCRLFSGPGRAIGQLTTVRVSVFRRLTLQLMTFDVASRHVISFDVISFEGQSHRTLVHDWG